MAPRLTRVEPPVAPRGRIGLLRALVRNPIEAWPAELYEQPYLRRRTLRVPTLFLCDPELVREALVEQAENFTRTTSLERGGLKPILGEGLLTTDGAAWRWQRRTASPVFRHERLLGFVPAMQAAAAATSARLGALPRGSEVELGREMMRTTFDIILATMLADGGGMEAARVEGAVNDLLGSAGWRAALALMGAPAWLPFPGRGRALAARDMLRRMVADAVDRGFMRDGNGQQGAADLLAHLARAQDPETGAPMDRDRVIDNILTFILAGHETTALALTWTFYLLSHYPAIAAATRDEVQSVTGGEAVTAEHLDRLVLTRQVAMEAMRLYPPAGVLGRIAMRDLTVGGLSVPSGTLVLVPIYIIHRHRALWDTPEEFNPERFAPEAAAARHRYAYLPFGAGPHTCIGMNFALIEAVVILATLLQGVRLRLRLGHDPGMRLRITLRPARGMPMTVE
jgi:cytochrome P450